MEGRTSIIAHRLSTIRSADQILVLDNGKFQNKELTQELITMENGIYKKFEQSTV
jgi:ABC-type transport system involved in Fe-S cluster assembly fused permease/ATPase subunit